MQQRLQPTNQPPSCLTVHFRALGTCEIRPRHRQDHLRREGPVKAQRTELLSGIISGQDLRALRTACLCLNRLRIGVEKPELTPRNVFFSSVAADLALRLGPDSQNNKKRLMYPGTFRRRQVQIDGNPDSGAPGTGRKQQAQNLVSMQRKLRHALLRRPAAMARPPTGGAWAHRQTGGRSRTEQEYSHTRNLTSTLERGDRC